MDIRRPTKEERIARVCYEINRAYAEAALGDMSLPAWDVAADWQRDSTLAGVMLYLAKPMTPEESHESWMQAKLDGGWKYGLEKCGIKKEHPCMVPYNELPREQQVKDYLFGAVIRSLEEYDAACERAK